MTLLEIYNQVGIPFSAKHTDGSVFYASPICKQPVMTDGRLWFQGLCRDRPGHGWVGSLSADKDGWSQIISPDPQIFGPQQDDGRLTGYSITTSNASAIGTNNTAYLKE